MQRFRFEQEIGCKSHGYYGYKQFKPIDRQCSSKPQRDRWSATPSKNEKVDKGDQPLNSINRSTTPPSLIGLLVRVHNRESQC